MIGGTNSEGARPVPPSSTSQSRLLREIYLDAAEIEDARERAGYLDEACFWDDALRERVESLLSLEQAEAPVPATIPVEASSAGPDAGSWIGPYKLLEQIGEGGFGVVYMAGQEKPVWRRVALKVVKPGMDSKQVVARFEAERQALAMMDHPGIAQVFEVGSTEAGRPYFVMELVRGIPLTEYCDHENFGTERRLELFSQVCHAVHHAHQKGVIHRDLKPSNVLVTEIDGHPQPKIIDFGISKAVQGRLTEATLFTAFEQLVGTPSYMSPEQASMVADDIDTRSDIYSLGVLLYELLTGSPPFDGKALLKSGLDQMRHTIREVDPERPSTRLRQTSATRGRSTPHPLRRAALASDLDWIVMKCLEKDRSRRYETALGLAKDVQNHLDEQPVTAHPPSRLYQIRKAVRRHKVGYLATAAVVIVLVAGAGVSTWQGAVARRANAELEIARSLERKLRVAAEQERDWAAANLYAADMLLAQRAWDESNLGRTLELLHRHRPALNRKDYRGFEWRRLWSLCQSDELLTLGRHSHRVNAVAFSPDGRHAATRRSEEFSARGEIRLWDLATGQSSRLRADEETAGPVTCGGSLAYSTDGLLLAYGTTAREVKVWSTVLQQEIASIPVEQAVHVDGDLAFVPRQHVLAIGGSHGRIILWDIGTNTKVAALEPERGPAIKDLEFHPDGSTLASVNRVGIITLWDTANRTELDTLIDPTGAAERLAFSPNGSLLASGGSNGTVRVWSFPNLKPVMVRTEHRSWISSVGFLPDGRALVSASSDQTILLWDTATWEVIKTLRGHRDEVAALDVSPNGERLLTGSKDGEIKLWSTTTEPDEPDLHRLPEDAPRRVLARDGSALALVHTDRTVSVWALPGGRELKRVPIAAPIQSIHSVAVAPQGRLVAYSLKDGAITLLDTLAGRVIAQERILGGSPVGLGFSFDGKILAACGRGKEVTLLHAESLAPLRTLSRSEAGPLKRMAFSWDNRSFAVGAANGNIEVWDLTRGTGVFLETGCPITGIALLPDRTTVLTSDLNAKLTLWDLETRREKEVLGRTLNAFFSLALSPDGDRIAAGILNGPAGLWDPKTGHEISNLGSAGTIQSLAFLPDGRGIVGLRESSVKSWLAPSWDEIEAAEKRPESSRLPKTSP